MARDVHERRRRLIAILDERGEQDVPTLVRELKVSEATLRRDLLSMEQSGQLVRTFGGARLLEPTSLVTRTFGEKRTRMRPEKECIARAAAELVEPDMIVALDSGTTVWRVAAALKEKSPLTILTSALAPLEELGAIPDITIHLVGGKFRLDNLDFTGTATVDGYRNLHADIAFFGVDSFLPGKGAFSLDESSAAVASAVARCADRRVAVLDHTKLNAKGCCLILASGEIDCLVTDSGIGHQTRSKLKSEPFKLILTDRTHANDTP